MSRLLAQITEVTRIPRSILLGREANILEEQLYTGYIEQGLYSKADLLSLATDTTAANASMVDYAVDFVGLPYDAGLV